ncbi:prephenate dehydrogenase (NADP(+)) [Basidiobolus ranarum]|uniref:Prephenate dehydrogenase [NADP(+)] n=1 Tax=Basidiobolus ranarum TaxID=34480 RepID=A0ABR2WVE5_9FUNG
MNDEKSTIEIGIIGAGDMGRLYGRKFQQAGWKNVNICDLPSRFEQLKAELEGEGFNVFRDGHAVSRRSDFIIYSVEAELIDSVVAQFGPSTKIGAVVAGQTSVKAPEIMAFEKHLPQDVNIVTCHSMHGPQVDTKGQPLVIIRHRSDQEKFDLVVRILESFESQVVYLTYEDHDRITADTQAVTHLAFKSMGTAWKSKSVFPWENLSFVGGIENVKVNMALRIYGSKWHVYAGLAIMNPSARAQIKQYADCVSELFELGMQEKEEEFTNRVKKAGEYVFGKADSSKRILLSDDILDRFSLSSVPKEKRKPNSHLSLLAIVDCWHQMKINPYDHMICQTPPFRLWLGITEFCFRNQEFLNDAIRAALYDKEIRAHDLSFYSATLGWAQCIDHGNMDGYRKRFTETAAFFQDRLPDASTISTEMIRTITLRTEHDL